MLILEKIESVTFLAICAIFVVGVEGEALISIFGKYLSALFADDMLE